VVYNPRSKAGTSFMRIAERLIGNEVPLDETDYGTSIWARLGRRLRAA